jgi:tRNA-splicing endonuclease subunit Sen34
LKEKGFYLTPGFKYGSDFLVYREDPNFIHSEFLLNIKNTQDELNIQNVIRSERISVSNKKKLLMAFVDKTKIKYLNLQWVII